ncbi:hypothetical protein DCAR_0520535 [Daucus carota subsp. sativus]|uniref:Glutamine amidotransferase domain-containing protein n=1 Tax=Daucus carota subsp. sativus TaxID=79200 RepID=A0AAF0X644_DAUCS|nr:PREDICTED: gamma-glutamyl peptidase 5-like [Daucus carota subsp. sativus]WOH01154.1 hypothetical protein DCAR_0520535 [Daucus carota subsp. sativus]
MGVEGDRKRFALLQAARDSEYVKKIYGGYFNLFVEAFGDEGETWDVFMVVDGEFPLLTDLNNYDGFVVSGSPYDAHGDDCWIRELCVILQAIDSLQKKVLGICFGHQVLCRALGGKVGKSNSGWDIGLRNVKFNVKNIVNTSSCSFLNDFDANDFPQLLYIIECHQDEVWEVPLGAKVIAYSEKTGVEMFCYGDHILGIQGHPEYPLDIIHNLIDRLLCNGSIQEDLAENARLQLQKREPDRKCWERICKGFLKAKISTKSVDKNPSDQYNGCLKADNLTENVDKNLNNLCSSFLKEEILKEHVENNLNDLCKGLLKAEILTENVHSSLNDLCKDFHKAEILAESVNN